MTPDRVRDKNTKKRGRRDIGKDNDLPARGEEEGTEGLRGCASREAEERGLGEEEDGWQGRRGGVDGDTGVDRRGGKWS